MHEIINPILAITELVKMAHDAPSLLDVIFGQHKKAVEAGEPVILFGAGSCGRDLCSTLRSFGVEPIAFCDNDPSKVGTIYEGLPIIAFEELVKQHRKAIVVIASHKYLTTLSAQILRSEFSFDRIVCKASDPRTPFVFMYAMTGTQNLLQQYKQECSPLSVLEYLKEHEHALTQCYRVLKDKHSRDLLITKLALVAAENNFHLFQTFISSFSQVVLDSGTIHYEGTPEDYYYFNNDVFYILPEEIYVDVGAYDGDTVNSFVDTCLRHGLQYRWIHAYEPDPVNYQNLVTNTSHHARLSCYQLGLWSHETTLKFKSSRVAIAEQGQGACIDSTGDIEIHAVPLDLHLPNENVSIIKADPGGNVISQFLQGATDTIARNRPKLALAAYHSIKSLFEIPLLVHTMCQDYDLYLRHGPYHLCDTDLIATIP